MHPLASSLRTARPGFTALFVVLASAFLTFAGANSATAQGFRDVSERYGFASDGKAAFCDYDGDGFVDLYAGGKLYHNAGPGKKLTVITRKAPAGGEGLWGDFDNDGHPDLFTYSGRGALYRNQGDGTFAAHEFPELATINSRGAVWVDLNLDGFLDLYVGGYEVWEQTVHPDVILWNTDDGAGDRKFVEHWRTAEGECLSARGVTSADFDEDGAPDVFVSNYRLQPNLLWRNDGAGKLTNVAAERGAAGTPDAEITYTGGVKYRISGHTIGSAFADVDADGHLDLFVGNFSHPPANQNRPQFLRNAGPAGNFAFEDRSADSGLAWQESFASPAFADIDLDGDLDLYFTTVYPIGSGGIQNFPVLYRNESNWKFQNVTDGQNLTKLGPTYQAAWADLDNDGDLDLCTAGKLFLNENPRRGTWLEVTLQGNGATVNRSAVGATARITLADRVLTRHVEAGVGEGNQNDLRLHFGLGLETAPVTLEITWPGGRKQTVSRLAPNKHHMIELDAAAGN